VQYGDRLCEACYRAVWRQSGEARKAKRRRLAFEPPAADAPSAADAQAPAAANDPDAAA
jgi:hypothetical protein